MVFFGSTYVSKMLSHIFLIRKTVVTTFNYLCCGKLSLYAQVSWMEELKKRKTNTIMTPARIDMVNENRLDFVNSNGVRYMKKVAKSVVETGCWA